MRRTIEIERRRRGGAEGRGGGRDGGRDGGGRILREERQRRREQEWGMQTDA